MVVPGGRFGMSKWHYNNPATVWRVSAAAIIVSISFFAIAILSAALGSRLWIALIIVLLLAWIFFGLTLYFIGPGSGWRGAWWIRLPRRLEEVLPRVKRALREQQADPQSNNPNSRRKHRWLRNAQVSLDLRDGICLWLIPGVPGSRAGLNPRLQPLTTLSITGLDEASQVDSRALRSLIQSAAEGS